jgi:ERCC4-type nuclease
MAEMGFTIDSRETNSGMPGLLREAGIEFAMEEMAAGDYQFGDYLIERKSVNDLAASILDGRLFAQAEAISLASPRPMFLIEGDLARVPNQLHEDSLVGAISALTVFFHAQVVSTPDTRSSARLLARMFQHSTKGLGYEISTRIAKPRLNPDGALSQYLVSGLPGVGPELARKLLAHFGTSRAVFAASEEELRQCKGVGPKSAEAIRAALDMRPTSYRTTKFPS